MPFDSIPAQTNRRHGRLDLAASAGSLVQQASSIVGSDLAAGAQTEQGTPQWALSSNLKGSWRKDRTVTTGKPQPVGQFPQTSAHLRWPYTGIRVPGGPATRAGRVVASIPIRLILADRDWDTSKRYQQTTVSPNTSSHEVEEIRDSSPWSHSEKSRNRFSEARVKPPINTRTCNKLRAVYPYTPGGNG